MGFGQRQQCYGDGGMRMGSASEEENYFFHEESWSSENNNFHKQHPAMQMNRLGGGMFQEGMHSDHGFGHGYARHGGGRKFPYGGSGGGGRLNSGGQHREYFSEETEYEECYREEHVGSKFGEMRYEKNNWGGETCYANGYDRNMITNMNYKPHKVQWTTKGV
ncbi:hypothetical protein V8G54_019530 [Vigna mungo]|uniref:Uncharacterized protein n=1 Tax=Vigna mungo TaxID=3915 RepID=A0AAQ3RVP2_VIGMU